MDEIESAAKMHVSMMTSWNSRTNMKLLQRTRSHAGWQERCVAIARALLGASTILILMTACLQWMPKPRRILND